MADKPMPYPESDRGFLTRAQVARLLKAIDPGHTESKQGMTYIAQYQARAEMNRIFGFGHWDSQTLSMEKLYEETFEKNGKPYYKVAYMAAVRVRIRDHWQRPVAEFIEYHAEENAPQPNRGEAHAMAITSTESYALRRALIGLGDRLGLGLYDGGSVAPLVGGTLQLMGDPDAPLGPTAEEMEKRARERKERQQAALKQSDAATTEAPTEG